MGTRNGKSWVVNYRAVAAPKLAIPCARRDARKPSVNREVDRRQPEGFKLDLVLAPARVTEIG